MENRYTAYAVKAAEIPQVQQEYTDIWNLVKRYYQVQEDEVYWDVVREDLTRYYQKHRTPNAKCLAIQFLEELDRRRKELYQIGEQQCRLLIQQQEATVCKWLGGKQWNGDPLTKEKVFQECARDFQNYFQIVAFMELPKSRFQEAVSYLKRWQPCYNTKLWISWTGKRRKEEDVNEAITNYEH